MTILPCVRILHLDDDPTDAALIAATVETDGLPASIHYVQNRHEFASALENGDFDIILSDYRMPDFDGYQALALALAQRPEIPFIMVTGELGEERAVETLQRGATDHVIKDRLFRLVPAIRRALAEAQNRRKRLEAEAALYSAHQETVDILDSIQDAFYAVDKDWRFTYVNANAEALWGHAREELIGQDLREKLPGLMGTTHHEFLQRAMQQHQRVSFECFLSSPGTWLETHAYPKPDGGLSVYSRDISRRKLTEEALSVERGKIQAAFESMEVGIVICNAAGTLLSMNSAALAMHEFASQADMHSQIDQYVQDWELRYPDGRMMPPEEWPISRAVRGQFIRDYEIYLRHRSTGREWTASYSTAPVPDAGGSVVLVVITIQDITERKKAEQEFRDTARFPEDNPSPVLRIAFDGTLLYANPSAQTQLAPLGLIVGRYATAQLREAVREASGRNQSTTLDIQVGEMVFSFLVAPFSDHRYANLYGRDITRPKALERRLRQSEELYKSLAEAAPDAVWQMDPAGRTEFINRRWKEYTGLTPETLNQQGWGAIAHPEDLPRMTAAWQEASREQKPYEVEARIRRHDGIYRWFMSRAVPIRDHAGKAIRWVGTTTDVHERKTAEVNLRATLQRLDAHVANTPLAVVEFDPHFRISRWSEEAERLFGWQASEVVGKDVSSLQLVHEDDRALVTQVSVEMARGVRPRNVSANRNYRKDGRVVHCEWYNSALYDEEGRLSSILSMVLDVTERKRAEEEVRKFNEQLEQRVRERTRQLETANRELEAFSYSVSHDLRAPLRVISGFAMLLNDSAPGTLSETQSRYLEAVIESAHLMERLINGLLAFSRIDRHALHPVPVDMQELAQEIVKEQCQALGPRGSLVSIAIGTLPEVLADALLMRQVMTNLLSNAFKFTQKTAHPHIELSAVSEPDFYCFSIRDNGAGFRLEESGKLFGVFQRLHSQSEFEGTGIGLANVKKIVERHGGRVWAKGEEGKGATFFFTLPRSTGEAPVLFPPA